MFHRELVKSKGSVNIMRFHLFLMMNTSAFLNRKKIQWNLIELFPFFSVWQIEMNPQIHYDFVRHQIFCSLFTTFTRTVSCKNDYWEDTRAFVYIFCLLFSHFYNIKIILCLFLFVETERNRKRDRECV